MIDIGLMGEEPHGSSTANNFLSLGHYHCNILIWNVRELCINMQSRHFDKDKEDELVNSNHYNN